MKRCSFGFVSLLLPAWLLVSSVRAGNPRSGDLRVFDDFSPTTLPDGNFVNGVESGKGWASPWRAAGFKDAASYKEGYKIDDLKPLAFGDLISSKPYLLGGRPGELATRRLDVNGALADFKTPDSDPPSAGRPGKVIWMSCLLRKNNDTPEKIYLGGFDAPDASAFDKLRIGIGYFGEKSEDAGKKYWSIETRNLGDQNMNAYDADYDVARSDAECKPGETALLVIKISPGKTSQLDLYVNPSHLGKEAPATPNGTVTLDGGPAIVMQSIGFEGGSQPNDGAISAIRIGSTFASVTPTSK